MFRIRDLCSLPQFLLQDTLGNNVTTQAPLVVNINTLFDSIGVPAVLNGLLSEEGEVGSIPSDDGSQSVLLNREPQPEGNRNRDCLFNRTILDSMKTKELMQMLKRQLLSSTSDLREELWNVDSRYILLWKSQLPIVHLGFSQDDPQSGGSAYLITIFKNGQLRAWQYKRRESITIGKWYGVFEGSVHEYKAESMYIEGAVICSQHNCILWRTQNGNVYETSFEGIKNKSNGLGTAVKHATTKGYTCISRYYPAYGSIWFFSKEQGEERNYYNVHHWVLGSTVQYSLSIEPEVLSNRHTPIDNRIYIHPSTKELFLLGDDLKLYHFYFDSEKSIIMPRYVCTVQGDLSIDTVHNIFFLGRCLGIVAGERMSMVDIKSGSILEDNRVPSSVHYLSLWDQNAETGATYSSSIVRSVEHHINSNFFVGMVFRNKLMVVTHGSISTQINGFDGKSTASSWNLSSIECETAVKGLNETKEKREQKSTEKTQREALIVAHHMQSMAYIVEPLKGPENYAFLLDRIESHMSKREGREEYQYDTPLNHTVDPQLERLRAQVNELRMVGQMRGETPKAVERKRFEERRAEARREQVGRETRSRSQMRRSTDDPSGSNGAHFLSLLENQLLSRDLEWSSVSAQSVQSYILSNGIQLPAIPQGMTASNLLHLTKCILLAAHSSPVSVKTEDQSLNAII
ncbi:hypothetical protein PROFUN_05542 [Planoprotostelium fungivorum]|uniref:Uncharacterized protein n=1 Tax=Planoprotostelium fungivorum TaxID=1890364 RepID=A0A2P6N019_9EUKA|nr:hypothetical protein PROFUN_05542 [Planoprotostelium fungivorum]